MRYFHTENGSHLITALQDIGCSVEGSGKSHTVRYKGKSIGFVSGSSLAFWNGSDEAVDTIIKRLRSHDADMVEKKHKSKKQKAFEAMGLGCDDCKEEC